MFSTARIMPTPYAAAGGIPIGCAAMAPRAPHAVPLVAATSSAATAPADAGRDLSWK